MRIFSLLIDLTATPPTVAPTLLRSLKAHTAPVIVADTDPTGTLLATGGADGLVKVWDIKGGFVTHNLRGHGGVISALKFYAPKNASRAALPTEVVTARNFGGKKKNQKRGESEELGWRLATGADDTKIRVWDLVKSNCIAVLDSHVSVVRGLDWSADGRTLVSGGRDKVVCLWDTKSWKLKGTIPVLEELEMVGFLAPGALKMQGEEEESSVGQQVIYMGGRRNRIRLWDLAAGKEITRSANDGELEEDEEREAEGIVDIMSVHSISVFLMRPSVSVSLRISNCDY